jgi:protein-tyrosine phosphatase
VGLRFVDCHSHVVPSGDDGAPTVQTGVSLCREAARHGTRILFATPHVWPELQLPRGREDDIRAAYELIRAEAGLELRLGFELTPDRRLLDEDPHRFVLEGTDAVLMEVPFLGPADLLIDLAEHTEAAGLRPVIAHPERTEAVLDRPVLADELAERGWLLQVNGSSLLGRHGEDAADVGWDLLERGVAAIVASDGHRPARPPHLDDAYELAVRRLGDDRALPLFDGTALGLAAATPAAPLAVPPSGRTGSARASV